jgi:predicted RNase H-like nuclease (RuvC/YqgF family)
MDSVSIYTVLITALTVLGSTGAWRFYEKRAINKEKSENFMKDECRERIVKLEVLLERSSKEKDEMRQEILKLTSEVSELRVKVDFFQKETDDLAANKRKPRTPRTTTKTK